MSDAPTLPEPQPDPDEVEPTDNSSSSPVDAGRVSQLEGGEAEE